MIFLSYFCQLNVTDRLVRPKEIIESFLRPYFLKNRYSWASFYSSFLFNELQAHKTDAGTLFLKLVTILFKSCACTVIYSDINLIRPKNG